MSRDFDGVDDIIAGTITAIDSGSWTLGAWIRPDGAGEGNVGRIFEITTAVPTVAQRFRLSTSSVLLALQNFTPTQASTTTTNTLTAGTWYCVFATFDSSDAKCRIYIGSASSAVAEASYSAQVAGTSVRTAAGTVCNIGNTAATAATFDGRIARVFADARLWTLAEMEAFRLGRMPVTNGSLRGHWPLDSPTASQAEDLSGNTANGTVTGAIVAEDPPIPAVWAA